MKRKRIILIICLILMVVLFGCIKLPKQESFSIKANANNYANPPKISYITKISFSYDTNKVRLNPGYTYRELKSIFESNWYFSENSLVGRGNNNINFLVCPTTAKCDLAETTRINDDYQYDSQIENKYTYIEYEIYPADGECRGYDTICNYDFDPSNLNNIEVWINDIEKEDAIIGEYYNSYWHEVDVYVPMEFDDLPLVKKVTVKSEAANVQKGTTSQFTASVSYYGEEAKNVNWTITGTTNPNTTISNTGLLTVSVDEESSNITVRATSTYNNTIYAEKTVSIIDEPLSITSVSIKEKNATVVYGGVFSFTASVDGTGNHDVNWTITGANSENTIIDSYGTLTVAHDETAKSIEVTATNVFDNTKKDTVSVITRATEIINKIEINYDQEAVVFSSKTTYGDVVEVLNREASSPNNAGYDRTGGIWIAYCSDSERCTTDLTYGNSDDNMLTDKYSYIDFYIFAKPVESDTLNPLYDFDSEHLEDIEIWVNGVKRDDAFAENYSVSYRRVDVYIPITVSDGKLAQYMSFQNDPNYVTYGNEPEKITIRNYDRIGDGAITYTSSDETIATVDNEGYVTPIKVGTCTITATAAETENYKEFSVSYTLEVLPKNVWPTISGYEQYPQYTGEPIHPEFTVTINNGEITLVEGIDYTTVYGENTNLGAGYIQINTIEGSNYTFASPHGVNIYVQKRTITEENVTIKQPTMGYTGEYLEPEVTIEVLGKKLIKDSDYTISYSSNLNIGTAYISIYGSGNYSGYIGKTFEIVEVEPGDLNRNGKIDLSDVIISLKCYLGIEELPEKDIYIADIDEDDSLTLKDVILLLKKYLDI